MHWNQKSVGSRWLVFGYCLIYSSLATAVSLDGVRSDAIKAAEVRLAECNIKGYDAADMPIPGPIQEAEKNYFRKVMFNGSERYDIVGHFMRATFRLELGSVNQRGFLNAYGHPIAYFIDGSLNHLSFGSIHKGVFATLNAYKTFDRFGRLIHDFNGNCQGTNFTGLVQQGLYQNLLRCIDEVWGAEVAREMCTLRSPSRR